MYLGEDATILFKLGNMSYVMCDLISKKVSRSVYRTVQRVDKAHEKLAYEMPPPPQMPIKDRPAAGRNEHPPIHWKRTIKRRTSLPVPRGTLVHLRQISSVCSIFRFLISSFYILPCNPSNSAALWLNGFFPRTPSFASQAA